MSSFKEEEEEEEENNDKKVMVITIWNKSGIVAVANLVNRNSISWPPTHKSNAPVCELNWIVRGLWVYLTQVWH
jgi:hypothetical protein